MPVLKWLLHASHISARSHNKKQEIQAVSFTLRKSSFGFTLYITQEELQKSNEDKGEKRKYKGSCNHRNRLDCVLWEINLN